MAILSKALRRQLETAVKDARDDAESAAREAIIRLRVAEPEGPSRQSDDQKALRRRLRAHARTLGDTRDPAGNMTTVRLQDAAAYELWHRMLFGRFLAERNLLIHPELGAAISVAELRDLAREEGVADEWALAEQYAAPVLPGVFKPNDPVLDLPVAPEFSSRLRAIVGALPDAIFMADDSLGWSYQFWRSAEKAKVNKAGGTIGAAQLPAVTQLFTESYMVRFLLHNTLGAWWAGKVLANDPTLALDAQDEEALRIACSLPGVNWDALRFIRDLDSKGQWRPAAGTFSEWPTTAAGLTYCDPCCGSGHFLVDAFLILAALRKHEEGLSPEQAAVRVISENLYGLEIDGRCVQIAAFNVALAAWSFAGEPVRLPPPNIAWVGAPPPIPKEDMAALGGQELALQNALRLLHDQFVQARTLGSLLEVGAKDLLDHALRERGNAALERVRSTDAEQAEGAFAARGLLDATALLTKRYTLLATNVPFLTEIKFSDYLDDFISKNYENYRHNLATVFMARSLSLCADGGCVALVSPQIWLYSKRYGKTRSHITKNFLCVGFARLGPNAFHHPESNGESVCLNIIAKVTSRELAQYFSIDASDCVEVDDKALAINSGELVRNNFQERKLPTDPLAVSSEVLETPISAIASALVGITTSDANRFIKQFWELQELGGSWEPLQSSVGKLVEFGGRTDVVLWEKERGSLAQLAESLRHLNHIVQNWRRGKPNWGKLGISISQMAPFHATLYDGNIYDSNCCSIIPKNSSDLPALWCFVSSGEFQRRVEELIGNNRKAEVGNFLSIGIDHWRAIAKREFPDGLPLPYSDDPTQWLFHGHPAFATAGTELHVALARLAGYRWPAEVTPSIGVSELSKERSALACRLPASDRDGIMPLHAGSACRSLADRVREIMSAADGAQLTPAREHALVRSADALLEKKEAKDASLEGWLSDRAFRQHCALFGQRPFIWHIWDGMRGGFSVFVNYQKLNRATLERLCYTFLGDWIRASKAEQQNAKVERGEQLQQKLERIIRGEAPYDIFVRWKTLAEQPLGWEPNINDGVRLNIRPFMTAGILREEPKGISWNKDRGADFSSAPWFELGPEYGGKPGDRINDHHTTLAEKRAARVLG
jgi:hypothetical protein